MSRRRSVTLQFHHMDENVGEAATIRCPHCEKSIFIAATGLGDGDTIILYYSTEKMRAQREQERWRRERHKIK